MSRAVYYRRHIVWYFPVHSCTCLARVQTCTHTPAVTSADTINVAFFPVSVCLIGRVFYTHVHIHTYIHTHSHTHTHTCIHTHIHTHAHICAFTHPYMHTFTHTHTHTHTHFREHTTNVAFSVVYACITGHICAFTHTYMHTFTHKHTHISEKIPPTSRFLSCTHA